MLRESGLTAGGPGICSTNASYSNLYEGSSTYNADERSYTGNENAVKSEGKNTDGELIDATIATMKGMLYRQNRKMVLTKKEKWKGHPNCLSVQANHFKCGLQTLSNDPKVASEWQGSKMVSSENKAREAHKNLGKWNHQAGVIIYRTCAFQRLGRLMLLKHNRAQSKRRRQRQGLKRRISQPGEQKQPRTSNDDPTIHRAFYKSTKQSSNELSAGSIDASTQAPLSPRATDKLDGATLHTIKHMLHQAKQERQTQGDSFHNAADQYYNARIELHTVRQRLATESSASGYQTLLSKVTQLEAKSAAIEKLREVTPNEYIGASLRNYDLDFMVKMILLRHTRSQLRRQQQQQQSQQKGYHPNNKELGETVGGKGSQRRSIGSILVGDLKPRTKEDELMLHMLKKAVYRESKINKYHLQALGASATRSVKLPWESLEQGSKFFETHEAECRRDENDFKACINKLPASSSKLRRLREYSQWLLKRLYAEKKQLAKDLRHHDRRKIEDDELLLNMMKIAVFNQGKEHNQNQQAMESSHYQWLNLQRASPILATSFTGTYRAICRQHEIEFNKCFKQWARSGKRLRVLQQASQALLKKEYAQKKRVGKQRVGGGGGGGGEP